MEVDTQDDTVVAISPLLIGYAYKMYSCKNRRRRKVWLIMAREIKVVYNALVRELSLTDSEDDES